MRICCENKNSQRVTIFSAGLYLCVNSLFNVLIIQWDYDNTIYFIQGQHGADTMQEDVLEAVLMALQLACGLQVFAAIFLLLHGVLTQRKSVVQTWLCFHSFLMAFFMVYLFAGILIFILMEDRDKVLLLMYGIVNFFISACMWRMVFLYIKVLSILPNLQPYILNEF